MGHVTSILNIAAYRFVSLSEPSAWRDGRWKRQFQLNFYPFWNAKRPRFLHRDESKQRLLRL